MIIPENATVFSWDADPAAIATARARGEPVVVLPRPPWWRWLLVEPRWRFLHLDEPALD